MLAFQKGIKLMMGTWRDHCGPIICAVIEKYGTADMKLLRRKLREAYPYGERARWPYKVWCSEINIQLGLKRPGPGQKTDVIGQQKMNFMKGPEDVSDSSGNTRDCDMPEPAGDNRRPVPAGDKTDGQETEGASWGLK